jgi:hypothetical protein
MTPVLGRLRRCPRRLRRWSLPPCPGSLSDTGDAAITSPFRRTASRRGRHSARKTVIGLCFMARRAGSEMTSMATTISTAGPAARASGSRGLSGALARPVVQLLSRQRDAHILLAIGPCPPETF